MHSRTMLNIMKQIFWNQDQQSDLLLIFNKGGALGKNHKRVMDVWMDEYKEYVYIRRPHYRNLDPGISNEC